MKYERNPQSGVYVRATNELVAEEREVFARAANDDWWERDAWNGFVERELGWKPGGGEPPVNYEDDLVAKIFGAASLAPEDESGEVLRLPAAPARDAGRTSQPGPSAARRWRGRGATVALAAGTFGLVLGGLATMGPSASVNAHVELLPDRTEVALPPAPAPPLEAKSVVSSEPPPRTAAPEEGPASPTPPEAESAPPPVVPPGARAVARVARVAPPAKDAPVVKDVRGSENGVQLASWRRAAYPWRDSVSPDGATIPSAEVDVVSVAAVTPLTDVARPAPPWRPAWVGAKDPTVAAGAPMWSHVKAAGRPAWVGSDGPRMAVLELPMR